MPQQQRFSTRAAFATSSSTSPPLHILKTTFLVQLIELRTSQHDIALSVHCDDLLRILTHKEMLAEDYVVKDAAGTEDIAYWLGFCRHVFDVDDLGGHVPRGTATDEEVVGVIGNCCETEVDYYWLFAQDYVVRLQISMDNVFSCHFCKASK